MTDSSEGPWLNRFVWHDLMTTDAKASQTFYTTLLGWTVKTAQMDGAACGMLMAGPGPIGRLLEEKAIPHSHWMPYIAVDDVDASAARRSATSRLVA